MSTHRNTTTMVEHTSSINQKVSTIVSQQAQIVNGVSSTAISLDVVLSQQQEMRQEIIQAIQNQGQGPHKSHTIWDSNMQSGTLQVSNGSVQLVSTSHTQFSSSSSTHEAQLSLLSTTAMTDCNTFKCSCKCHTTITNLSTPNFLQRLLGRIEIRYTGVPQPRQPCTLKTCKRHVLKEQSAVSVQLDLPEWFAYAVATIQSQTSMTMSTGTLLRFHLTTPRVLNWKDYLPYKISRLHSSMVIGLIKSGKLTPNDQFKYVGMNEQNLPTGHSFCFTPLLV